MELIVGSQGIIDDLGYWPSFHDDHIDGIYVGSSSIEIYISSFVDGSSEEYKLKFIFTDIDSFELKGDVQGICSIILDLVFVKDEGIIKTGIYSSMGVSGIINSKAVKVIKI